MTPFRERLGAPHALSYPGTHLGLHWRPLIASDAPGVYDLCQRTEEADDAIHRTSHMEIAEMVEGRHGRDCIDTIVGVDSSQTIVAVATVRVLRNLDEMAVAVISAVVDPSWRGRGIGRSLLFWQDGRARQMLVEVYGPDCEYPISIVNLVDSHMTDRRRLCIAAGFAAANQFQVVYRELVGGETELQFPTDRGALFTEVPLENERLEPIADTTYLHLSDHHGTGFRHRWWHSAFANVDERWSVQVRDERGLAGYCYVGRPAARWVATGRPEAYVERLVVREDIVTPALVTALLSKGIARAAQSGMTRIGLDYPTKSDMALLEPALRQLDFIPDRAQVMYTLTS